MRRILIFIAFFVSIISLISCSGGSSSSSAPEGVNPGFPSDIQLVATQYIVQTNSDAFFKARVLDGNGRPIANVPVTFTNISPIGTINAAKASKTGSLSKSGITVVNTNSLGWATIRVFSSIPGFVTVQAEVNAGTGKVRDKKTIYFSTYDFSIPVPVEPSPTLELAVDGEDADTIFNETEDFNLFETADDDEVIVRATVLDGDGDPAKFVNVAFGADSIEASFPDGTIKMTDSDGQAQVRVKVDPALKGISTTINITASAIVNGKDAFNMVTLFLPPISISIGNVSLNATPTQVAPGGTSKIDAYVSISTGGAAPDGTTVNFTTTCGFVIPFAQTTDGKATVDFTAPLTFGTCTITGTVAGVSGSVNVVVSNALFIMPASQTIGAPAVGNTATYTVTGGTGPYMAYSSNPGLVTVPSGSFAGPALTATVSGVPTVDTTVTITVYDSVNASATATLILDVAPVSALTVIPATQTISNPTLSSSATYTVMGGTRPYTAFSGNPALVTVPAGTFTGPTFVANVDGLPTVNKTVMITVYDSVGANKDVTLVLDVTGMELSPKAVTVTGFTNPESPAKPADNVTFTITGGTGPYSMFSSNDAIIASQGALGGSTFTVDPDSVASSQTVTITVVDFLGATATSTVTVNPPVSSFSLNPSAITVLEEDSIRVYMAGGTGPYQTFTTDATGSCVPAPGGGSLLDIQTSFVVGPIPTNCGAVSPGKEYTITLVDSIGNIAKFEINVIGSGGGGGGGLTFLPAAADVIGVANPDGDQSDDVKFIVTRGDGTTVYSWEVVCTSSQPTIITAPMIYGGVMDIDPGQVSTLTVVTISCTDTYGNSGQATVTVRPPNLTIKVNPIHVIGRGTASGDGDITDDVTVEVIGGVPPYIVHIEPFAFTTIVPGGPWSYTLPALPTPWTFLVDPTNVIIDTVVTFVVVDNTGATDSTTLTVYTENTGLVANTSKENVIGIANPDGNIADDVTITVAGANSPFIVSWVCLGPPIVTATAAVTAGPGSCPGGVTPCTLTAASGAVTFDPNSIVGPGHVACTVNVTDNLGSAATMNITIWP